MILERPCVLYVDHREDMRIVDALRGVENLSVVVVQLEVGDFHARWGDAPDEQLVVERKTAPDLEQSIREKRLAGQVEDLSAKVREGTPCYLLQQGDPYSWSTMGDARGAMPEVAVTSGKKAVTFVGLALKGIRVVPVETWQSAAKTVFDLIHYSMSPALLGRGADPKRSACKNQGSTAAGRPEGQSSGSTRSEGDASPAT